MGVMNQTLRKPATREGTLRGRRRRGFWLGLGAGALLVVALDYGGEWVLVLLSSRYRFHPPAGMSLRSAVFLGMIAGIALTGGGILLTLGWSGAGYLLGPRRIGPFRALARGARRLAQAAWALGLTLGVVGGTAWFLIPRPERPLTLEYLRTRREEGLQKGREWMEGLRSPSPAPSPDKTPP